MNKEEIIKRALIILHTTGYTNELEKSLCIDAIENLQQENKQLKEKCDYLKKQKDNKNRWFQLIADIGFDYDGYNDVENLKHLIDELVQYSLYGRDNDPYEQIMYKDGDIDE